MEKLIEFIDNCTRATQNELRIEFMLKDSSSRMVFKYPDYVAREDSILLGDLGDGNEIEFTVKSFQIEDGFAKVTTEDDGIILISVI